MGTIRKTITLTEAQDAWLKAQIDAGAYTNDSEAIRDLIRKAQALSREGEIDAIRAALIEGEQSGMSEETPETIRARVLARQGSHGAPTL
jgi:antitoxin ParD1/3/4